METQPYKPVPDDFHDEIEALCTLLKDVDLIFVDQNGRRQTKRAHIVDVYTKEHEEFAKLSDGVVIRLDRIVSLNGKDADSFNFK